MTPQMVPKPCAMCVGRSHRAVGAAPGFSEIFKGFSRWQAAFHPVRQLVKDALKGWGGRVHGQGSNVGFAVPMGAADRPAEEVWAALVGSIEES